MNSRLRLLFGVGAPVLIVVAAVLASGKSCAPGTSVDTPGTARPAGDSDTGAAKAEPLRCAFDVDDRLAFKVSSKSRVRMAMGALLQGGVQSRSGTAPWNMVRFDGRWMWRILERGETPEGLPEWTVGAAFGDPTMTTAAGTGGIPPEQIEEMRRAVRFRIDERCRFTSFDTASGLGDGVRSHWQNLLMLLEFEASASGRSASWQTRQVDGTGTYIAHYRREGRGVARRVTRARVRYTQTKRPSSGSGKGLNAVVRSSASRATPHPEGRWYSEMVVREHVSLEAGPDPFVEVDSEVSVTALDPATVSHDLWAHPFDEVPADWAAADELPQELERRLPYADRPPIPGLALRTLPWVLEEFTALMRTKPQMKGDAALVLMSQYLRMYPDVAADIVAMMRTGELPGDLHAFMFLALQVSGGEKVHGVLAAATRDPELSNMDRMRAASALGDVPDPDARVVQQLRDLKDDASLKDDLITVAALALAKLAGNSVLPEEERQHILEGVAEDLERASSISEIGRSLAAVGNTGQLALKDRVEPYIQHESPFVRTEAQRTLTKIGGAPEPAKLLDTYEEASDEAMVRRAVAKSLLAKPEAMTGDDIGRSIEMLGMDQPQDVRRTLITLLGTRAKDSPEARKALVAHFSVERNAGLLQLIGKYLPAKDLH